MCCKRYIWPRKEIHGKQYMRHIKWLLTTLHRRLTVHTVRAFLFANKEKLEKKNSAWIWTRVYLAFRELHEFGDFRWIMTFGKLIRNASPIWCSISFCFSSVCFPSGMMHERMKDVIWLTQKTNIFLSSKQQQHPIPSTECESCDEEKCHWKMRNTCLPSAAEWQASRSSGLVWSQLNYAFSDETKNGKKTHFANCFVNKLQLKIVCVWTICMQTKT